VHPHRATSLFRPKSAHRVRFVEYSRPAERQLTRAAGVYFRIEDALHSPMAPASNGAIPSQGRIIMTILILGLVVFLGVHSVRIVADDWRTAQIERMGLRKWKLAYTGLAIVGLVL